jgi:ferredoxin--NADP+ reductase
VILKANENGERIPLTMADTDPEKGTITIIYIRVLKRLDNRDVKTVD